MSKHSHAKKPQTPAPRTGKPTPPQVSAPPAQPGAPIPARIAVPDGRPGRLNPAHDLIASLAYQIWESHGRPPGTDRQDWLEAERRLRGKPEAE